MFCVLFYTAIQAQERPVMSADHIPGQYLTMGFPSQPLPENSGYFPALYGMRLSGPFSEQKQRVGWIVLPHMGIARGVHRWDGEVGINAGLYYQKTIPSLFTFRLELSSGPHFVTVETRRQARGFIFSDNLTLHLLNLGEKGRLSIFLGYRHISNAALKEPNGGIDNLMVGLVVGRP